MKLRIFHPVELQCEECGEIFKSAQSKKWVTRVPHPDGGFTFQGECPICHGDSWALDKYKEN